MPLARIEIVKGHSRAYRQALLECVHEVLESILGMPRKVHYLRLIEIEDELFRRGTPSNKFTIIEFSLFPGRSDEMKQKLINKLNLLLSQRLFIIPEDVYVIIAEIPLENWGINGKQASDLIIPYKKR